MLSVKDILIKKKTLVQNVRDSLSSEEYPRTPADYKLNFSAINSTNISWASTVYRVLLSAFYIRQTFLGHLLGTRSCPTCWGSGNEQNRLPKRPKHSQTLCLHEGYILPWDIHNKQIKCKSAKEKYVATKGCRDCWLVEGSEILDRVDL